MEARALGPFPLHDPEKEAQKVVSQQKSGWKSKLKALSKNPRQKTRGQRSAAVEQLGHNLVALC